MAKKQSQPTIIDAEVVSESPSQALAIRSPQDALAMSRKPEKVLEEAKAAATALMQVVESKPKKIQFNGQTYLTFEDWQTLARFYGYTVREDGDPEPVSMGDVQGFKASAVVLDRDGIIRSRATSYCMNDEDKWSNRPKYAYVYLCRSGGVSVEDPGKDEIIWEDNPKVQGKKRPKKERKLIGEEKVPMFQLASMAQTRACAKALRNTLAWVAVLAGYAATPAEEMNTSSEPPSEDFNQDDRPSEHSESAQAKVKKFAGTVIDAQRIDAGDHQVLVLKLRYGAKRKGKDGKWTTVTEETIVVAEQSNFMRLLERSRDSED